MEILTEEELILAVEGGTYIKDGRKGSCEGIKYDFTISKMALTAEFGRPRDISQSQENAVVKPGEIAFIMTEESLNLPDNIYCQLSTKRKLSLEGIFLLGGLIIDPNYKGKLIFGLYNSSPRNYPLLPGRRLVAGVFYRLNKKSDKIPDPINDFPDELIKIVVDTKPNSINAITKALEELKAEMQALKNQFTLDEQWKKDFQTGLTDIQQLVKEMGEKLGKEIETRQKETHDLGTEQANLTTMVIPMSADQRKYQNIKNVLISVGSAIIGGLIVFLVSFFLNS
jgi:dUTPase